MAMETIKGGTCEVASVGILAGPNANRLSQQVTALFTGGPAMPAQGISQGWSRV